jgi:UDP-3-O-[3-hydroxymyristoyl] glucosamine N-acyltransferase
LAELVGGELIGDGEINIESAAPIASAGPGQISFLANSKYEKYLAETGASALVISAGIDFDRLPVIKHQDPYYAFALILDRLYPEVERIPKGVDPAAVVADSAKIGENCAIGALSYIGPGASVGNDCIIHPNVHVGHRVKIGNNCKIYPGVNILDETIIGNDAIIHSGVVLGSDGFGFARHKGGIKKVKQVGWVEIGNDVEIGANCTVDRGALGPTRIGNHVKIDNLVQIAHNVEIGDYSIIVAQVGISGSTELGRGVILAGQVGLVGHIKIGDGAQIGAQSGVTADIPAGKIFLGSPAREMKQTARIEACLSRLPDLFKRIRELEKKRKSD